MGGRDLFGPTPRYETSASQYRGEKAAASAAATAARRLGGAGAVRSCKGLLGWSAPEIMAAG